MNDKIAIWSMAAVFTVILVAIFLFSKEISLSKKVNSMAYGGVMLALAFGLSYIKLFTMPFGGSVTLVSMLPIMLYAYIFGVRNGLMVVFVYSILQCLQGIYYLNFLQFLFDYIIGFTALGFAGIMSNVKFKGSFPLSLVIGMSIGIILRYLASVTAGVAFWGEYAPENQSPLTYSLIYNTVLLVDGAIALAGGITLMYVKPIKNALFALKTI